MWVVICCPEFKVKIRCPKFETFFLVRVKDADKRDAPDVDCASAAILSGGHID
jgi:hypothetical protein